MKLTQKQTEIGIQWGAKSIFCNITRPLPSVYDYQISISRYDGAKTINETGNLGLIKSDNLGLEILTISSHGSRLQFEND